MDRLIDSIEKIEHVRMLDTLYIDMVISSNRADVNEYFNRIIHILESIQN